MAIAGCGRLGFDAVPDTGAPADVAAAAEIGCADGTCEGFVDEVAFPHIASYAATWTGELDLRAPRTGSACGGALQPCASPADACATGWHVCATSGDVSELLAIGPDVCSAEVWSGCST